MEETSIYIPDEGSAYRLSYPHTLEVEEVLAQLGSSEQGLSQNEAFDRQGKLGRNILAAQEKESHIMKFLEQFKEPLILLLLSSAVISLVMGEIADAVGIFLAVFIVNVVGFIQEYRSNQSVEALKSLITHRAKVLRSGVTREINAEDVVPGDILLLEVGERIAADVRLVTAISLQVDESILTGELEPTHKIHTGISDRDCQLAKRRNLAFMGTKVVHGKGKGVVIATGSATELGRIWGSVINMEETRTPLQDKMDQLGKQLSVLAFAIVGIIFVLGALQGKPLLDMFTIGVSLAVAAIPEGLPIVVTVTLALGVTRMAKRKAIVRKLPAVEALGSTTAICSDKTGTLTKNEMTVRRVFTTEFIEVSGDGYDISGGFFKGSERIDPKQDPHLMEVLKVGLFCNTAQLKPELVGQPTEAALLVAAEKAGLDDMRRHYRVLGQVPFSPVTKWMSVQYDTGAKEPPYYVKGAIDAILEKCTTICNDQGAVIDLSSQKRRIVEEAAVEMGEQSLRVVALAYGSNLGALTLVGLVGIIDPPREEVKAAIDEVQRSGVHVAMITGDSKETAIAIAKELGFYTRDSTALSYKDVHDLSEAELADRIENVAVFYRMSPEHKTKIIEAYQRRGHIVAMTGDGVNDAPALKRADIGIAMGSAADITRETAEMILVNNNFATIVSAIEEGKSIYNNIKNFLRFQLTTSIATLSIIASSTVFGLPNPLNPIQILWINIIMDGPPAQSLGVEPLDRDVMKKPPRDPRAPVFTREMFISIGLAAFIMVVGTLGVFYMALGSEPNLHVVGQEGEGSRASTMCFTTFVMFQMFNALNCRSEEKSAFHFDLWGNMFFMGAVGGSILLQLAAIYVPLLQSLFGTVSLSFGDLLTCVFIASAVFAFDEGRKYLMKTSRYRYRGSIDL